MHRAHTSGFPPPLPLSGALCGARAPWASSPDRPKGRIWFCTPPARLPELGTDTLQGAMCLSVCVCARARVPAKSDLLCVKRDACMHQKWMSLASGLHLARACAHTCTSLHSLTRSVTFVFVHAMKAFIARPPRLLCAVCCVHLAVLGTVCGGLASHTSGFCSALEQLPHSVALLLSLSAAASSFLGIWNLREVKRQCLRWAHVVVCIGREL